MNNKQTGRMNIIGKRYWFFLLSAIIIIPGIISLAVSWIKTGDPLKLGLDFKSGSSLTLQFNPAVTEAQLRQSLTTVGYPDLTIQHNSDGDYLVRLPQIS